MPRIPPALLGVLVLAMLPALKSQCACGGRDGVHAQEGSAGTGDHGGHRIGDKRGRGDDFRVVPPRRLSVPPPSVSWAEALSLLALLVV